jgi:hypothetical protein
MKWLDVTRYPKGEKKGESEPRQWALCASPDLTVAVNRSLGDKSIWFLHCYAVNIDQYRLNSPDIETAKKEAIAVVLNRLAGWKLDLERTVTK